MSLVENACIEGSTGLKGWPGLHAMEQTTILSVWRKKAASHAQARERKQVTHTHNTHTPPTPPHPHIHTHIRDRTRRENEKKLQLLRGIVGVGARVGGGVDNVCWGWS